MTAGIPPIAEDLGGPLVKQFTIFLENKVGALLEVVKLLHEHHVNVLALNVQDSADAAMVRVVVSDPDRVETLLHQHQIGCAVTPFVVVELKSGAESLAELLAVLLAAEVNIHGCYALLNRPRGRPVLALHVEDNECAATALRAHGFQLLSQNDLSR